MSNKKLSAGDITEARCTRCREVTNHTIVAMVGERVARVQCNTCSGVHNYKSAVEPKAPTVKAAAAKAAPASRKSPKGTAAAELKEWETLRPAMQAERALPYTMVGKYKLNDLVNHPTFGLGVVKSVGVSKVEILFEGGKKLLRCL